MPGARHAFLDIVREEFSLSTGNLLNVLLACIISVEVLYFWLLRGGIDISTSAFFTDLVTWQIQPLDLVFDISINSGDVKLVTPAITTEIEFAFLTRVVSLLLIVPFYFVSKFIYYAIAAPEAVFTKGQCPRVRKLFSLDWFTAGVLMTTLPLAMSTPILFILPGLIIAVGAYGAGYVTQDGWTKTTLKLLTVLLGGFVFFWLMLPNFWASVLVGPGEVSDILVYTVPDVVLEAVMGLFNAYTTGPLMVALFAMFYNTVQSEEELQSTPGLGKILEDPVSTRTVFVSAFLGTLVFLLVNGVLMGEGTVFPTLLTDILS